MKRAESVAQLASMVADDVELANEIKQDPTKALAQIAAASALRTDKWIYRIVVIALGSVALAAVVGGVYLPAIKVTDTPEILVALGAAAIGALAGLLSPSPGK